MSRISRAAIFIWPSFGLAAPLPAGGNAISLRGRIPCRPCRSARGSTAFRGTVYALLRDAIAAAGVIGVVRVVMHNKERLAALIADGEALLLNTLRWAEETQKIEIERFVPASEIAFTRPDRRP
jgi:Ku70/Ku80 beta-barrel domain